MLSIFLIRSKIWTWSRVFEELRRLHFFFTFAQVCRVSRSSFLMFISSFELNSTPSLSRVPLHSFISRSQVSGSCAFEQQPTPVLYNSESPVKRVEGQAYYSLDTHCRICSPKVPFCLSRIPDPMK